MSATKEQIGQALNTLKIVADCIKAAGEIPSGHLYAQLMAKGMDLPTYEKIIGLLVRATAIVKRGDVLVWNLVEG